jgi:DDE superfamily endonuclease
VSLLDDAARVESLTVLSGFRTDFYRCLTARADALFELTDALLCTDGSVKTLVDLALAPEHRRSHGMLYDGLGCGRIDVDRLRMTLAGLPLPRAADGRIVLGVDVSPWLRSDAPTSAARLFCHVYGRAKNQPQLIPGSPGARRRRHRRHRLPAPRRRRPPDRGPTLAPGRSGHPDRLRRRLRRHPAGVRTG